MAKPKLRLFERLCDLKELEKSWRAVLAHYTQEAIPPELREFERHRGRELARLAAELRERTFIPEPASLIFIPKPTNPGEMRPIALIKADDRIVLTTLSRLLAPIFERKFLDNSYAYRPGRGAWAAVQRIKKCLGQSLIYSGSGDIDEFFASIDRTRLIRAVRGVIWEQPICDLVETYLHMGVTRDFEWVDSGRGISQGSPLSPLLSNLALTDFDRFVDQLGPEWIRYADNFILLAQEPEIVRDAFEKAEAFLLEHDVLRLNPESRRFAAEADGFSFLGFWFHNGRQTMTPEKLDQKRRRIAEILRRHEGVRGMVEEMSETIRGWRNYYGLSPDTRDQLVSLERHLADLLIPWLQRLRGSPESKSTSAAEWKAALLSLELPVTSDSRQKLKWVDLAIARSRPAKKEGAAGLSTSTRQAIRQRKREYEKLKLERQEVQVTKPGTYLGRTGERLLIRHEGKREAEIPLSLIHNITLLTKAVSLSGELIVEAAARGINIVLPGVDGRPLVRIGPAQLAEHQLSLAQSALAASPLGLELARTIVAGKIRNQANLLRYYLKYPERRSGGDFLGVATQSVKEMEEVRDSVVRRDFGTDHDLERNRLFAAEGQAAASYWQAVRTLLWWKPGFEGRVRRGASDLVNSLLNYGYGILYSRCLSVLLRTGLNIYVGFLHKPQPGKAGLLYDFVEEFRAAAVDRTVFGLLNLGAPMQMNDGDLSSNTRQQLARKVIHRLQSQTRYHGESLSLEDVMGHQARLLVQHMEGKTHYETFVLPW